MSDDTPSRQCTRCLQSFPPSGFHKVPGNRDGLSKICRVCKNADSRRWMAENKERFSSYRADYQRKNPDKSQVWRDRYHVKNPDAPRIACRSWRKRNPDFWKRWEQANPEKAKLNRRNKNVKRRCVRGHCTIQQVQSRISISEAPALGLRLSF